MANIRGFEFPDELYYLVEHDTWARQNGDGSVTVGVTPLGAHISGTFITFMPKPVGTAIERNRALGMLEMSKIIRSARSPAAGTIVAVNERLQAEPQLINADPYGAGWLVRLQPRGWEQDARLLATGPAILPAVTAYMGLLAEQFDQV